MNFSFRPATREQTPLLIGLIGPTWTGKTYSALRLATGIAAERGGQVVGIDTEARRMLQYANEFKFSYLEFGAPFSSLRYAEALTAAAEEAKGGCVIMDSMSHEHEGPGGYLDTHSQEVERLCKPTNQGGGGFTSSWAAQIPAWNAPSQARRKLINTLLQLNCAFVFCFRAKEKIKPVKGGSPLELGWQAIAGEEFGFEMTARCLLTPGCKGTPDWSDKSEKLGVPKRIKDHVSILADGKQLDENVGRKLAQWASGAATSSAAQTSPSVAPADSPKGAAGSASAEPTDDEIVNMIENAKDKDDLAAASSMAVTKFKGREEWQAKASAAYKVRLADLRK